MAIITISRGSFAGGKAVAEALAQRLGYPAVSREEVLQQAARKYGVSETELAGALNEAPPFWQQVPGKRLAYVKCVTAVMLDIARAGNFIYHGYVGHLLLSGIPHVVRVRVIADLDSRVAAAMKRLNLNKDQAIAHVQRVDRERARWARLLYGVEWDDPIQYDLIVNLERIGVEGACEMIARASELEQFEATPDSLRRLEDLSLSCRVWAALAGSPEARSAGIQVTANGGEVMITGNVGSGRAADAISRIANQVSGVKVLHCEVGQGTDWYW